MANTFMTIGAMALALSIALSPADAQTRQQAGETKILNAANGGIRDYKSGAPGILFLRDRTERWYRVQLTGDCLMSRTDLAALAFTTDTTGTFDLFSQVVSSNYPQRRCGVTSIVRSDPPPSVKSRKG